MFIPSINLGIEYDGKYWHKDKLPDDIDKNRRCMEDDIELVRIREYGLPDISRICKCFYLTEKGTNLSDVIKQVLEYISYKINIPNEFSIDINRDYTDIMSWYKTTKDRIINMRWDSIVEYYSMDKLIKNHPSKSNFCYCIFDGSIYYNVWHHRNMFYLGVSNLQKYERTIPVKDIIDKVDGRFMLFLSYFKIGQFCFENKLSRDLGLIMFEKLYRLSSLGRFSLRFPPKVEYIYDNPLWNMIVEQISNKAFYMNEGIEAQYAFYYGDKIYGMVIRDKKIVVSDAKKFCANDDIFDEDLNYQQMNLY